MAVQIRWSPSSDTDIDYYNVESGPEAIGPWTSIVHVSESLTGSYFNTTLGLYEYTDQNGSLSTWYRVTVVNQLGILSSPSAPFQSIGLVSPPLADVDELKAYLDITHTNDDALITTLIAAASTFVESYTGVDFRYRLKTEIRDGDGGKLMTLRERPVVSIVSVAIDEQSIAESVGLSVDGWYFHDGHLRLRGHRFTLGDGNVQISYTCGYPVVPFDIKQAVIEMAGLKYRDRTRIGKTSESMAGQSVSFLPAVVPLSVLAVLDAYRRIPCL